MATWAKAIVVRHVSTGLRASTDTSAMTAIGMMHARSSACTHTRRAGRSAAARTSGTKPSCRAKYTPAAPAAVYTSAGVAFGGGAKDSVPDVELFFSFLP